MVVSGEQELGVGKVTWYHLSALKMEGVTFKYGQIPWHFYWEAVICVSPLFGSGWAVHCDLQNIVERDWHPLLLKQLPVGRKHRDRHRVSEPSPAPAEPFHSMTLPGGGMRGANWVLTKLFICEQDYFTEMTRCTAVGMYKCNLHQEKVGHLDYLSWVVVFLFSIKS